MIKVEKLKRKVYFLVILFFTQNIFAQAKIGDTLFVFHSKETGKLGYKNSKKEIIVSPIYDGASFFEGHDYYIVTIGEKDSPEEKYAMLNNTGKIIIDFKEGYEYLGFHYIKKGILLVIKNDKKGLVNVKNEIVLPIEYDFIDFFKNGFTTVRKNNKDCVLNESLKLIIDCKYEHIGDFTKPQADGRQIASATLNGKTGCLDTKGNIIIPFLYQAIQPFDDGIAQVFNNNKYGYIDLNGKVIINIIYKNVSYNPDTKSIVANDGKNEFTFNTKGKLLKKQKYIIPTKEIETFNK
jgi:WG containing repeat